MRILILFLGLALMPPGVAHAQNAPDPQYWVGRIPTEINQATNASLLAHPYFQNMTQRRQYYSRSQMRQVPSWMSAQLLTLSFGSPWFYYAIEGCKFETPASLVSPQFDTGPHTGTTQNYVFFRGTDCEFSSDFDFNSQVVTFMLPSINYDNPQVPLDTTVYACAEIADVDFYDVRAFPITYSYFRNDRRNYYIGLTTNYRSGRISKPEQLRMCSDRDDEQIAQMLLDLAYPNLRLETNDGPVSPISTTEENCPLVAREFARADGGPGRIDYVRECS